MHNVAPARRETANLTKFGILETSPCTHALYQSGKFEVQDWPDLTCSPACQISLWFLHHVVGDDKKTTANLPKFWIFWNLPYVRPSLIRGIFGIRKVNLYDYALSYQISHWSVLVHVSLPSPMLSKSFLNSKDFTATPIPRTWRPFKRVTDDKETTVESVMQRRVVAKPGRTSSYTSNFPKLLWSIVGIGMTEWTFWCAVPQAHKISPGPVHCPLGWRTANLIILKYWGHLYPLSAFIDSIREEFCIPVCVSKLLLYKVLLWSAILWGQKKHKFDLFLHSTFSDGKIKIK